MSTMDLYCIYLFLRAARSGTLVDGLDDKLGWGARWGKLWGRFRGWVHGVLHSGYYGLKVGKWVQGGGGEHSIHPKR